MDVIERFLRRYLNLTPNEQNEFLEQAGLNRIPDFKPAERIIVLKPVRKPVPKPEIKEKPIKVSKSFSITHLSFEERIRFLKENALEKDEEMDT
ncbi:MAG: hypothetical protein K9G46_07910 [Flavobacteriales bacterium]|jgi:hypothetical protein|nr:hypothetical protein [Flavobacteriales bacterium]